MDHRVETSVRIFGWNSGIGYSWDSCGETNYTCANAAAEMTSVVGLAEKWNQYFCDELQHRSTVCESHTSSIQP